MKGKYWFFVIGLAGLMTVMINACNKVYDEPTSGFEPVRFIQPDSSRTAAFAGETIPLEVVFTTDQPIDSISARVHVDSTGLNQYNDLLADSLFIVRYTDKNNLRTYVGTYTLANDSFLDPTDVIRIQFTLNAGNIRQSKQLRIDVK